MSRFALSAHLGYLFTEVALEERFAAAARAGFAVIEHPSPYTLPAARFRELCDENGLHVAQIALPAGRRGEKGLAALVDRRAEFAASLAQGIDYALAVGSPLIHPMAGVPEGGADTAATWTCYIDNLALACEAAKAAGLTVIIEPIGPDTLAGYYMDHPDLAVRALEAVGSPDMLLSFDVFHATRAGVDLIAFTAAQGARFGHVQIADDPGRHEPATGGIDFARFFDALDRAGYSGPIGLEYHPLSNTIDGLEWVPHFAAIAMLTPKSKELP